MAARKPNNMRYSEYMMTCALSLQQNMEFPTDKLLPSLLKMQQLSEEANTTWYLKSSDPLEVQQLRAHMHVELFKKQLEDCVSEELLRTRKWNPTPLFVWR